MTIVAEFDLAVVDPSQGEQLAKALGMKAATRPLGLLAHIETVTRDGMRMIDVWESRAALDRFIAARVEPMFRAAGVPRPNPPEVFEVHDMFFPDA